MPEAGALGGRVAESAQRGAEQGMPPDALLQAYQLAFAETWRACVAAARPEDLPDVLACTELVMEYRDGGSDPGAALCGVEPGRAR